MRPGPGQRGASLLEVAIAAALLVAGLAGILGMYALSVASERGEARRRYAETMADDLLEELAAVPAPDLEARAGELAAEAALGVTFRPRLAVDRVAASPTLRRVRVEVHFARDAVALETLRSLRLEGGP